MMRLPGFRSLLANHLTRPLVWLLAGTAITPSAITWSGFVVAIAATALIVTRHLFLAGLVVLAAGFFDMLDGALARHKNQVTPFGAVLDSVLDRVSEMALLLGILVLYAAEQLFAQVLLVAVALLGSLLVSYIRARAEAIGLECKVGLFTRVERVIVLALGLLLSQFAYALVTALTIIAAFSFITVIQRLVHVWQQTRIK